MIAVSIKLRNKKFVWDFLHGIAADNFEERITHCLAPQVSWQGPHPINKINGVRSLARTFYEPLFTSFPDLERQDDVFMAGPWRGGDWVCATGHYVGTFRNDWLHIPATGTSARLRFGDFYKVEDGLITDCFVILDMIGLMQQAGVNLLPPCCGEDSPVPGPDSNDGVLLSEQPDTESEKSAQLVEEMIADLMRFDPAVKDYSVMRHERCWHEDMKWYGPAGIGTTYGIEGFIEYHQRPFLTAFPDRRAGDNHVARPADGNYVASTGWPSVIATHTGDGWLGQQATNRKVGMRVMDFWRRDGDRFRENWVLIDIPELLLQMGFDLFAQIKNREEAPQVAPVSPGTTS